MARRVRFADDRKADARRSISDAGHQERLISQKVTSAILAEQRAHEAMKIARTMQSAIRGQNSELQLMMQGKPADFMPNESLTRTNKCDENPLDWNPTADILNISKTWITEIFHLHQL